LLLCYNAYVDHEGDDDEYDGNDQNDNEVRKKRQAEQYEYTPTKTRCPLLLVADYRFYQEMGDSNTKTTINYLVRTLFLIIH
jgi:disintegrin and metalloproteinase domain-containing protein 17